MGSSLATALGTDKLLKFGKATERQEWRLIEGTVGYEQSVFDQVNPVPTRVVANGRP